MIIELVPPILGLNRVTIGPNGRQSESLQFVVIDSYQSIDVETDLSYDGFPPRKRKPYIRINVNSNLSYTILLDDPVPFVKSLLRDNKINEVLENNE